MAEIPEHFRGSPNPAVMWHENARWLANVRIPLMTSYAELFLDQKEAWRIVVIPRRLGQYFRGIMMEIRWDGSLEGQIYVVCVWIDE